jgi:hypothetical protein
MSVAGVRALFDSICFAGACALAWLACAGDAHAWILQIPRGAELAPLPQGRVLCGPNPEGWEVGPGRQKLRPKDDTPIGKSLAIAIAQQAGACSGPQVEAATLVVTGELPTIDANSVTLALDAGRLELRGEGLEGVRVGFSAGDQNGDDVCLNVTRDRDRDVCALNIDRTLPADPHQIELHWAAPGGLVGPDVVNYDKHGAPLADAQTRLTVARLLISRMFPDARMVDVGLGAGKVLLQHPEAVSGVECGAAHCQTSPEGVVVQAVPAGAPRLPVRLQLLPKVFMSRGDLLDTVVSDTLTVLRCPMNVVSGEPLRNVDDVSTLVRLEPSCVADVQRLRFSANAEPLEVMRVETLPTGIYVLLWVGRIASERLTVVASREDGSVLAVANEKTMGVPPLMATLSLPGYGEIQFIPRNQSAVVNVSHVAGKGELVPVSVPGAYDVSHGKDGYAVRGVYASGGFAALRFAYRVPGLPESFTDTDFGEIVDPVQRPIREASIPAPIGASSITSHAMIELFCKNSDGKLALIPPGTPIHVPYKQRDSCRLLLHRERIPTESGEQRLDLDITVTAVGGVDRADAHLTEHLGLRHQKELDVIWIRGAKDQFDRINVRITHVIDETLFDGDSRRRLELPSSQWTVVTEDAKFKFYATAAVPASLYRFSGNNDGSGTLSLNLGVLARLTWLDSEGHEGLIGIEAGMMGMGLATDTQRQLALVAGFGVAIPLGNANQPTQAAVNIHLWMSYSVGGNSDGMGGNNRPWAIVFGPSITVGSIAALL